ncbi:MAG: ATP-binding protein [Lachnospiraceae bacterium]|nr:ATP-binding protein [Lachnospiraceae bacterium]
MYLEELIEDAQLENDKLECKALLNRDDVIGWLKSVAGLANASGGEFYIGVEDKTNKLIGFDRKAAATFKRTKNNPSVKIITGGL